MTAPSCRFTRHQVPRGTLADLETPNRLYLMKNVSRMRATYQVRMLLCRAEEDGKKLVLRLPKTCKLGDDLVSLRREHPATIIVERV
jgi:hypothetical protein